MNIVNYDFEYKEQLKKNISLVREDIESVSSVLKIKNFCEKYNYSYESVVEKILGDDMFAVFFAKEPSKQNIYEKIAAKYVSSLESVSGFENYPNSIKLFVINGNITNKRENDVKSIDFHFKVGDISIYASHKYIKDSKGGGAQDNQYNEVRNFLRNCNKLNTGDVYYIAICDGAYFDSKIGILNNDFGSSHVRAMPIDDLENFITSIKV